MPDILDHALLNEGWVALEHSFLSIKIKETALGTEGCVGAGESAAVGVEQRAGVHG